MPNILKYYDQTATVESYDFPLEFFDEGVNNLKKDPQTDEAENSEEELDMSQYSDKELREMYEQAKKQAAEILAQAEEEAAALKEQAQEAGRKQGYEEGYAEGKEAAYTDHKEMLENESKEFLEDLKGIIEDTTVKKEEILRKYSGDLRDIAIAVAEKVIQVGLKSSGKVIEKMIVSATDKIKNKEWAKIYIAKCDADLVLKGDADIMQALSYISDHVKIVIIEEESPGTCIIELPDEIIDASANTQMENIKEILSSTGI